MAVATETRATEPCRFCAGPRVHLANELPEDVRQPMFTFVSATICLRCDGPAPVRVPVVPVETEQPQDGAA